jgi:uncharacterized protein YdcH (DUF465 family)
MSEDFIPYAEKIAKMLSENERFADLFGKYEEINNSIYNSDAEINPLDDLALEGLKKQRLALKDQIMSALAD